MSAITKLSIFDMDGTLLRTPEPHEGKDWWLYHTRSPLAPNGERWAPRGWWSEPASLNGPPGYPFPIRQIGHVMDAYRAAKQDPTTRTIIMTGRVDEPDMRLAVEGVLRNAGITDLKPNHDLFLKPPQQGRYFVKTLDWKLGELKRLHGEHPELQHIHMWEDREAHKIAFEVLLKSLGVGFTVTHVQDPGWSGKDVSETS